MTLISCKVRSNIARICLYRPERHNAINTPMQRRLACPT